MSQKSYLLKNAHIVNPVEGLDYRGCLAIHNGKFILPEQLPEEYETIDLHGWAAAPGFVDMHVHLRDPGQTQKEDVVSATNAAAAGGFTTVLAMANTVPVIDTPERYQIFLASLTGRAVVHVLQSAAITLGRNGRDLTDFSALAKLGIPVLTDDGSTPQDDSVMRLAMQRAAKEDLLIVDHCEDNRYSKPGVMHQGAVSERMHLPGQPRVAEERIVKRDIDLCRETGCRIHLQHLSSAGSIELLRRAQKEGLPVSGEATPHHLMMTDQAVERYGVNAKMAPPLREETDRQALIQALLDGTISAIATDHAPHTAAEKAQGMLKAPFGIIGLEAAVSLMLTLLYHSGKLTLLQFVSFFTSGPAAILHRKNFGTIALGASADLTIFDPEEEWVLDVSKFQSKGRNCPYDGQQCKGRVKAVFVAGKLLQYE